MKKCYVSLLFIACTLLNGWANDDVFETFKQSKQPLTLLSALQKTLEHNPQLHQFDFRRQRLQSERELSDLKPGYELGVGVEDFAGNGNTQGVGGAELTVALSSVIELGDKRQSRVSVVKARLDRLKIEQQAQTLDVLGEVTVVFIQMLATQEELILSKEAIRLADTLYKAVKRRALRGAASEAEAMLAKSQFLQSQIQEQNLQRKLERQKVALARFWGDTSRSDFQLEGDLYTFGKDLDFDALFDKVKTSPAMKIFASEMRLKRAEIRLAKTENQSNLSWQFGVKRAQGSGETSLIAGFSMPLFSESRNQNQVNAALAESNAIAYQRTDNLLSLHEQVFSAYSQRQQHITVFQRLNKDVIPVLESALTISQKAYERGGLKYQDWIRAQQELLSAKQHLIESARSALINQVIIEQLTVESISDYAPYDSTRR